MEFGPYPLACWYEEQAVGLAMLILIWNRSKTTRIFDGNDAQYQWYHMEYLAFSAHTQSYMIVGSAWDRGFWKWVVFLIKLKLQATLRDFWW